jgi:ClpP class serine protease
MGMWLIEEDAWRDVQAARAYPIAQISADMRERFASKVKSARESGPLSLSVKGDEATILISGVLTAEEDFWLWLFDIPNTTYADIQAAIAQAEGDPRVKSVQFIISSPGGEVDGLFETTSLQALMKKPKNTLSSLAASAAFALASNGGRITAVSHAATFGSVGVVASYRLDETRVDITSTEAPDKRPDPATPKGQATIRTYLDQIHDLYAETIAAGRGVTVEKVNAEYGRGNVMLASEAKSRGMIDKVLGQRPLGASPRASANQQPEATPEPAVVPEAKQSASVEGVAQEEVPMDLKKLKAEHADVHEAAVQEGIDKERKRCKAHVNMAKKSGANDIAFKAIETGASFSDEEVQSEYMAFAMNKRDTNTRQDESNGAGAVVDPAKKPGGSDGDAGTSLLDAAADAYCGKAAK